MKKFSLWCLILILSLVCFAATAEGNTEKQTVVPEILVLDVSAIPDGTYPASFIADPVTDADGSATLEYVTIFTVDTYTVQAAESLKAGDSLVTGDGVLEIESLDTDENHVIAINGGWEQGGLTLMPVQEQEPYYVSMTGETGYCYTEHGTVDLKLTEDVQFVDYAELDPDGNDRRAQGAEAIEMLRQSRNPVFTREYCQVLIRDGRIAEIDRMPMPESSEGLQKIMGRIVEGRYELWIMVDPDDTGIWVADTMEQDPSVVKLESTKNLENVMVARYAPVADGEVSVHVRHMNGSVSDEVHGFDLRVVDGKVQEVFGGSYTHAPAPDELDSVIRGEWLEAETQFTQMTITRREDHGWNLEIISPATHGAYIMQAVADYDCETNALVYDQGTFYDVPITAEENADLGDPVATEVSGQLSFEISTDGALQLHWYNSLSPDTLTVFEQVK